MNNEFIERLEESRSQRRALQNKRAQLDELNKLLVERQKQIEEALERVRVMKAIIDANHAPQSGRTVSRDIEAKLDRRDH